VSADFGLILLAGAAAAWGTSVALRLKTARWAAGTAVILFAVVGIHAAVLVMLTGDGRVLPGRQINPAVVGYWGGRMATGSLPTPHASVTLLALLAHVLLAATRPSRAAFWLPVPATLAFLALFGVFLDRNAADQAMEHVLKEGPQGRVAYLTIDPHGKRARLVLAAGKPGDTFLDVLLVEEVPSRPERPRLSWSGDGTVVALGVSVKERGILYLVARGLDGAEAGALPPDDGGWPEDNVLLEPIGDRRRNGDANVDVRKLMTLRGGIAP